MVDSNLLSGVLVVDKPVGPTSHTVVARVKKILGTKVGHTGTLDPAASGVLPLVLGRATRLAQFIIAADKVYRAEVRLGIETDTYDAEGNVVAEKAVPDLSLRDIEEALDRFRGKLEQIPPMYSAIKIRGERLYKAARRNEIIERPARPIEIFQLDLVGRREMTLEIDVHCSAGTYIRSLAHDLGRLLGCGAHLESLRRTRTGSFDLASAVTLEEVAEKGEGALIPLEALLPEYPRLELSPVQAERVSHGNPLPLEEVSIPALASDGVIRLFEEARLLALGKVQSGVLKPFLVLYPA